VASNSQPATTCNGNWNQQPATSTETDHHFTGAMDYYANVEGVFISKKFSLIKRVRELSFIVGVILPRKSRLSEWGTTVTDSVPDTGNI
jgi:hypothetical protein